jgi:uridine kinase
MIDFDAAAALIANRPETRLIGIDGLPVSGKSTLADRLETELGAQVLYLDDFVRPEAEWRGRSTPAFPFEYIRYAEFLAAAQALGRGDAIRIPLYDWSTGRVGDDFREVRPEGLVVVEGVSALHPDLAPLYDLRLWVESDAATTLSASLARGVGDWEREWGELFMPSVALYLETEPKQRADHVVAGRGMLPQLSQPSSPRP